MDEKKIVVFGGSAGSIEVLLKILPGLPETFPLPIVVVLHRKDPDYGRLKNIFKSQCAMNVVEIEDKTPVKNGTIFIAPPGYHLLVESDYMFSLDSSEKINYSRPSIDLAFESIVNVYNDGVVGILLSGANEDGANGMQLIKDAGGIILAQSSSTSLVATMPKSVENIVEPNNILSPDGILNYLFNSQF